MNVPALAIPLTALLDLDESLRRSVCVLTLLHPECERGFGTLVLRVIFTCSSSCYAAGPASHHSMTARELWAVRHNIFTPLNKM